MKIAHPNESLLSISSCPKLSPKNHEKKKIRGPLNPVIYEYFVHSNRKEKEINHTWIDPKVNDKLAARNATCEICSRFAPLSSNVLQCIYCSVICHLECFRSIEGIDKIVGNVEEDLNHDGWVCFYCHDSLQYDLQVHETATLAEQYRQIVNESQILIAKHWRRYHRRKWYVRIYSSIVHMQIQFQVRKRKRVFLNSVQAKLRTIKLKVQNLYQLLLLDREAKVLSSSSQIATSSPTKVKRREYTIYIVVTVYDLTQGNSVQTWRIESPMITIHVLPHTLADILLDEKFILGGVSGFQHVVLSIFQKGVIRDIFLGQVGVELSANSYWKKGGKFLLPLMTCGYELKDAAGMDFKADYRLRPQGMIQFEIITANGMNAEACSCYGTSVEEILRSLGRLPDSTGFIIPMRKVIPGAGRLNPLAQIAAAGGVGGGSSDVSVNSSSIAGSSIQTTTSSTTEVIAAGMKKLWIAVAEGKVYIFGHFGDQLKLTLDIQYFSVSYEFLKGNNVMYKLYRMGYPEFHFYPVYDHEIFRMKCAFLCSVRYAKGFVINPSLVNPSTTITATTATTAATAATANTSPGASAEKSTQSEMESSQQGRQERLLSIIRTSSNDSNHPIATASTVDRFDMGFLITDLLALEILKNQRKIPKVGSSSFAFAGKRGGIRNSALLKPAVRNSVQLSPINRSQSKSVDLSGKKLLKNKKKSTEDVSGLLHSSLSIPRSNSLDSIVEDQPSPVGNSVLNQALKGSMSETKLPSQKSRLSPEASENNSIPQSRNRTRTSSGAYSDESVTSRRSSISDNELASAVANLTQHFKRSASMTRKTEEKRDSIRDQIIEELTREEVASDTKFQNIGEKFVKSFIDDLTGNKVQQHLHTT